MKSQLHEHLEKILRALTRSLTTQEKDVLDLLAAAKENNLTPGEDQMIYEVWCAHVRPADRNVHEFMTFDEIEQRDFEAGERRRAGVDAVWVPA